VHSLANSLAQKKSIVFALLACAVIAAYSNSLRSSWHLDDYANIVQDARIHVRDLSGHTLLKAMHAFMEGSREARPFARMTLALNWYFGRNEPFGYHAVNVLIHISTAWFLYLAGSLLLAAPRLKYRCDRRRHFIVLLAVGLWALNPIQTQAVTYVVQRMAALAAFFYVTAIYLYLKGRFAATPSRQIFFFLLCAVSFMLALASKENAATLPLALLLVEAAFFQDLSRRRVRHTLLIIVGGGLLLMPAAGILVFFKGDPLRIFDYGSRYFSPLQRLMTEPRILVLYLSQIFYPVPGRLSIEHDIAVSTSLLHPWTTLPCIVIVGGLVLGAVFCLPKYPLWSFGVLFFFLNHIIESSIIGLELVFEHRNYLPSLFLFFPAAAWLLQLLDYCQAKNRWLYRLLAASIVCLVLVLGTGTYTRNLAWRTEKALWEDAIEKAPLSGRPWHNLAMTYYERSGQREKAMVLYRKALGLEQKNRFQKAVILSNMAANRYLQGRYEQALGYWQKALANDPARPQTRFLLSLALIKLKKLRESARHLDFLIAEHPNRPEVLNLRGVLALLEEKPGLALEYFKRCFQRRPWPAALINSGAAFSALGRSRRAELFFKTIGPADEKRKICLLWLAWNAFKAGDGEKSRSYIDRLVQLYPVEKLRPWLSSLAADSLYSDSIVVPPLTDPLFYEPLMHKPAP